MLIELSKKQQGVIAVFLSIILLAMFLFSAVIVDGTRIFTGRNITSGAGQLAMNAALSNYDAGLKDAYGLLAMSKTPEEMEKNLHTYFVDSLSSVGVTEEEFSRALVYLEEVNGSFNASKLPNTEVCRGQVMEQQVLDYMKYRAPVTMAEGILDKLEAMKETKLLQKVAKDELDTAEAAESLQDALEDLYSAINWEYLLADKYLLETPLSDILKEIARHARIAAAIELVYHSITETTEPYSGGDIEELVVLYHDTATALGQTMAGKDADIIGAYTGAYDSLILLKKLSLSLQNVTKEQYMEFCAEKYGFEYPEKAKSNQTESEEDEEEAESKNEAKKEAEKKYDDYQRSVNYYASVVNGMPSDIGHQLSLMDEVGRKLNDIVDQGVSNTNVVIARIKDVRSAQAELKRKYDIWVTDSKQITTEEVKKGEEESQKMYKDFVSEAGSFEELVKAAEGNNRYYKELKKYMQEVKFADVLVSNLALSASTVRAGIDNYWPHYGQNGNTIAMFVESTDFATLIRIANESHYFDNETNEKLVNLKNCAFYIEYLDKYFAEENEPDQGKIDDKNNKVKSASKDSKGTLDELIKSSDLDGIASALSDKSNLPTDMMNQKGSESKSANPKSADIDDKKKRKSILNSSSATLGSNSELDGISGLFEKLSEMTESIMENPYLTEYYLNMFSYYTVDKKDYKNGKAIAQSEDKLISLSEMDLRKDVIYRAEAEYILWGNKSDARKNVGSTKAVIFAIYFVGNIIFALTQSEVTSDARMIGDLFLPNVILAAVVKVVVEVVVATVETVRDLQIVSNGGKVVILKILNKKEWKTRFLTGNISGKSDSSSDDILAFSYKDFLWCFLTLNNMSQDKRYKMLARAADLCQVNTNVFFPGKRILYNEPTMVEVQSSIKMNNWMITDIFNDGSLDTSGSYTINYRGIQGY